MSVIFEIWDITGGGPGVRLSSTECKKVRRIACLLPFPNLRASRTTLGIHQVETGRVG